MRTPLPVGSTVVPGTLRARMEELRGQGGIFSLAEAVGIVVPLTVEVAERHRAGDLFYLHPSAVVLGDDGRYRLSSALLRSPPMLPRDRACIAPEQRSGLPGGARSSVFSLGAILYELVTGQVVGPGMRRPSELVPSLPVELEVILSKALVADPAHRPDDLLALAQAVHALVPEASVAPPAADVSHLDRNGDFVVDVSMSLMPPPPSPVHPQPSGPYDLLVTERKPLREAPTDEVTSTLAALKRQLESDPRPRYVVTKGGMDHGPFNAVELLQQIAAHNFVEGDLLFDNLTRQERPIKDWEQFAPFAEQARLHRTIKAEKAALERSVAEERKSTASKAVIGAVLVGTVVLAGGYWFFFIQRGARSDRVAVQEDKVSSVESDAGFNLPKRASGRAGRVVGTSGGYPVLGGGTSCEAAQAAYIEHYNIGSGQKMPPDLTANQYGAILNRGTYLLPCGVPNTMEVNICAAVQNGRAVGVTVTTNPSHPGIAACVAAQVRALTFPSHPRLDVTRTTFK